jgi:hypothetical protein
MVGSRIGTSGRTVTVTVGWLARSTRAGHRLAQSVGQVVVQPGGLGVGHVPGQRQGDEVLTPGPPQEHEQDREQDRGGQEHAADDRVAIDPEPVQGEPASQAGHRDGHRLGLAEANPAPFRLALKLIVELLDLVVVHAAPPAVMASGRSVTVTVTRTGRGVTLCSAPQWQRRTVARSVSLRR